MSRGRPRGRAHRAATRLLLPAVLLAGMLAGCRTTRLVTRWQASDIAPLTFTNIVALTMAPDQATRRTAAEALCDAVRTVPCTPGFRVLSDAELRDAEAVKARLRDAGFDGALLFRIVSATEKVTDVPAAYGPPLAGFYRDPYSPMTRPGYTLTDTLVRVETSIYSVREDRMLWVATTESVNPRSVNDLVDDVAAAVRRELDRAHLIAGG